MVKYLIQEGIKCYKIPLPPVLSSKLGKYHVDDHNEKRLSERHFWKNIPVGEGRKRQKPSQRCFVCSKLPGCKKKELHFGVKSVISLNVFQIVLKFFVLS